MNAMEMNNNGYLLLFHSNEFYNQLTREQLQEYLAQNGAWFEQLMAAGKIKGGQVLARAGAMVSGKNGRRVVDGPFAEAKEVVGGYLLLNVGTLAEAVAVARSCPGLAYGTSVEVRPLTNVCPSQARLETLKREEELAAA